MKTPKKDVILICLLVLIFVGAAFAYRSLSKRYTPESVPLPSAAEVPDSETTSVPDAADFTVYDADGGEVRLSDFLGEPVLINFWASWCPPCRGELPYFEAAYQQYGDTIRFLMVDLTDGMQETREAANAHIAENGYTFPLYYDTTGEAANAYQLYYIPETVAISADGRLLYAHSGAVTEEALAEIIDALLAD